MMIDLVRTAIRFTRDASLPRGMRRMLSHRGSTFVKNLLQISLFLCKTNPNSKMPKLTHTLFYKGLMKILTPFGYQKTNPKQTQTKPISERAKMSINCFSQRSYGKISPFRAKKNKAKTNPISESPKSMQALFSQKARATELTFCRPHTFRRT